jgi:hypothetical protein
MCCVKTIHERDLFFPQKSPPISSFRNVKEISCVTPDSVTLHGYSFSDTASDMILIYFYGNGETVYDSRYRLSWLRQAFHVTVIAFDYRGYGQSEGTPGIQQCIDDALWMFDNREQITGNRDHRCVVYGRSIGTIMAQALCAQRAVDGCILEAPIATASEAIAHWSKRLPVPIRWVLRFRPEPALAQRKPQPIDYARKIECHVLVIHGTDDSVIPFASGEKIYAAVSSEYKDFVAVENAGHNNLIITQDKIQDAFRRFFTRIE